MVVMVPFDLAIIDSSSDGATGTLVARILEVARSYLASTGPAREAAAVLCARLLTRPGLQPHLRQFVRWGVGELAAGDTTADSGEGGGSVQRSFLEAGIA